MLLRQLQYLSALAREKHFQRAAAACQVTQPTLSAGIKHLEEQLGFLIVRRGQRFEGFTAEGERVLEWARQVEADMESLLQEASEMRSGLVGRLRIGAIPTALPVTPRLVTAFAARHPKVGVTVLSQSSIDIQLGMDEFSIDAGLTYLDNEPLAHVRALPLYRERYLFLGAADNPLSRKRSVSWKEAAESTLCLLTPDMQNRRILDAAFAQAGAQPRAAVETNSVLTLCALLREGAWCCILPEVFRPLLPEAGVVAVPLEPAISHVVGLVVPDREPLSPTARELARLVTEADMVESLGALGAPVTA
jgi:DNA-binding transcriptional LysR family regulator